VAYLKLLKYHLEDKQSPLSSSAEPSVAVNIKAVQAPSSSTKNLADNSSLMSLGNIWRLDMDTVRRQHRSAPILHVGVQSVLGAYHFLKSSGDLLSTLSEVPSLTSIANDEDLLALDAADQVFVIMKSIEGTCWFYPN
jgi:hypothetical protein